MDHLRLYTLPEVAEVTGLSRRSLEDGARAEPPKFAHVKTGGRRYMSEAQILLMIKGHTVQTAPSQPDEDARREGIRKRLERARRSKG